MKSGYESGFSDACLSGDKDEVCRWPPALARQGQLSKRGVPTDDSLWAEALEEAALRRSRSDQLYPRRGKVLNI